MDVLSAGSRPPQIALTRTKIWIQKLLPQRPLTTAKKAKNRTSPTSLTAFAATSMFTNVKLAPYAVPSYPLVQSRYTA